MRPDLRRYYYYDSRPVGAAFLGASGVPAWVLSSGGVPATLDIDFINDRAWNNSALVSIASLLSCSRASTGYYLKADGTLTSFSSNVLRYGTNGLLVEEARTNVLVRSQEFADAAWGSSRLVITSDVTTAPDGTATADLLTEDNNTGIHFLFIAGALTLSVAAYTFTVYAKPNGRTWLAINPGSAGGTQLTWFNLAGAGAVGTNAAGNTSSIEALANGWYRCCVTRTMSASNNFPDIRLADADNSASYAGNNTSGIYLWGRQLELGAFATSYIPTTSSSATRAADAVTFSDLTWFDGAAESLYAEWLAKNTNNAKVWALDATNDVLLDEQTGMSARIADAGASFAVTVGNTASAGATVKGAARMAANDIALCMNGGTVGTDTSATAPGTLSASRLGIDLSSGNALNSYIRRAAAFKSSLLNNAALQALTT